MMDIRKVIASKFGYYKSSGSEIQVNCPFCILRRPRSGPDRKHKLYINIQKGVYNCFRCDAKGKLSSLIPQLEVIYMMMDVKRFPPLEEEDRTLEPLPAMDTLNNLEYPWMELVDEFFMDKQWETKDFYDAAWFVEDYRKKSRSFGPRLIFPIYQFGCYRGFQGRTIYRNTEPKYIGATGMARDSILYNYDCAFSQCDQLVVTEGFLDCHRVGPTAIATLGKSITDNQLRLIRLGDFKKVIVFLDEDAVDKAREIGAKLAVYFDTYLALPKWDELPLLPNGKAKKDPDNLTKDEIENVLKNNLERIY